MASSIVILMGLSNGAFRGAGNTCQHMCVSGERSGLHFNTKQAGTFHNITFDKVIYKVVSLLAVVLKPAMSTRFIFQ
jgi:hypothetical protein